MNLLRTEWLKISKYPAFWWMLGITALSYPGVNYIFYQIYKNMLEKKGTGAMMVKMLLGNPFTFPEVWHTVAYASSIFIFIPAIMVIMFITNEYTYKTHRQNIIDGWSRRQFMTAKLIDVMLISVLITALYSLVTIIVGYVNKDESTAGTWDQSKYIGLFALQTFAQLSFAFFIAFFARRAFVALGIFVFYFFIIDPVLVKVLQKKANDIGKFLPLEISDRLIPPPAFFGKFDKEWYATAMASINMHIGYTVLFIVLIWSLCFWLNSRRDL